MRVGERLAELLVENGVEYVFGVPGVGRLCHCMKALVNIRAVSSIS
jgi:thiamine pyrophosphate-dependent acetolactate synthase large subunit-like protein